jgi:hypothetical protein
MQHSIRDLVGMAGKRLSFRDRAKLRFLSLIPAVRDGLYAKCCDKLCEDDGIAAVLMPSMGSSSFSYETPIQFDPDTLERILQILVEYLPQLLSIIMSLIDMFAMLLVCLCIPTTGFAMNPVRQAEIDAGLAPPAALYEELNPFDESIPSGILTRKWYNRDGLSLEVHAEKMHGLDTTGLTRKQIEDSNDHDHDRYGGLHPETMRAEKALTLVSYPVYQDCPGGVCPVPVVNTTPPVQYVGQFSSTQSTTTRYVTQSGCSGYSTSSSCSGSLGARQGLFARMKARRAARVSARASRLSSSRFGGSFGCGG